MDAVRNIPVLVLVLTLVGAMPASGQDGAPAVGEVDRTLPGGPGEASTSGLPGVGVPDTVRTNLWLAEALLGEVVTEAARSLPAPPAAVRLVPLGEDPRNDLFMPVAAKVLGEAGYDLYLPTDDPARQGAVDQVMSFSIQDISLSYPDVGRTLGIWRRWVEREMEVSVMVEITDEASGRLLLSRRIDRRFGDRVDDDDVDDVESAAYVFTNAEPEESGWQRRAEELVVLGTLAGLVAIYFANTGN